MPLFSRNLSTVVALVAVAVPVPVLVTVAVAVLAASSAADSRRIEASPVHFDGQMSQKSSICFDLGDGQGLVTHDLQAVVAKVHQRC
jgi:hypothetical protein